MDELEFKILQFLYPHLLSEYVPVADFLYSLYPYDSSKKQEREEAGFTIHTVFTEMQKTKKWLICQYPRPNEEAMMEMGIAWFDTIELHVRVSREGKIAFENEIVRREDKRLRQSQIDTNNTTKWSLIASFFLSIVSIALVTVTVVQTCNSKTDKQLEGITVQMKEQKKSFDSINSNLEKLYKATQKNNSDTTKTK